MSRYDLISRELFYLRFKTVALISCLSLILSIIIFSQDPYRFEKITKVISGFILMSLLFALILHLILNKLNRWYSDQITKIDSYKFEIAEIKNSIEARISAFPFRIKGERFKTVFNVVGKPLIEVEETLAIGMWKEQKEVFATVFMKNNYAVRMTATIGSRHRCSPSDDPKKWPEIFKKLNCDEIRQYHNHPVKNNKTKPSYNDYRSSLSLKGLFKSEKSLFKSYIIYWNKIGEWRILEYSDNDKDRLSYVFDITA